MSSPLFVDTGYIIALINKNDQYHEQAVELSGLYENFPLVTTEAILLEVGNALSRRHRRQALSIIDYFQTSPEVTVVPLTADLFASAIGLYATHSDKTWGLVDCVSFVVMEERQISVALAFDSHFIQAGFTLAG
ncbi:MAG: type II toxin-antitoxin system VapC family toxin [Prochloron sp. SP5CPC1]|nr:type II toxin-antitoxin system VapC family toxin [Candidatus Paraprochloron terpiosi SP5CPC1]